MTGSDHYEAADRILRDVTDAGPNMPADERAVTVAIAQVHATLASAAALVEVMAASADGAVPEGYGR